MDVIDRDCRVHSGQIMEPASKYYIPGMYSVMRAGFELLEDGMVTADSIGDLWQFRNMSRIRKLRSVNTLVAYSTAQVLFQGRGSSRADPV
jgi:hypothetical protein